jgi:hypothetical protein
MKLTTRQKIVITSVLIPFVFILFSIFEVNIPFYVKNRIYIIPGVLGFVEAILVAWVVNFKLKGERIFTVPAFPGLSLSIFVAFLGVVVRTSGNDLDRISTLLFASLILGAVTYVLTANINILNLASIRNIPLGQAGRAAHYVLTLVFSYFGLVLLVSWNIKFFIKPVALFVLIFTFTFVALWTISLSYAHRFISSLGIALIITFAYLVLALWPLESFYYAFFVVLLYYMVLGVALEIREIINKWLWYEYAIIFLVMLLVLLATARWGVNGTVFL